MELLQSVAGIELFHVPYKGDDVKATLAAQGMEAVASTPAEFRSFIEAELLQWGRVIKHASITVN